MNDEEFFQLLNKFPLRDENQTRTTQSQPQQTNLFSLFGNLMGGLNRQSTSTTTTTTTSTNKEEEEFWLKLKSFLTRNVNNQEEADTIYNNFKINHEKYLKEAINK